MITVDEALRTILGSVETLDSEPTCLHAALGRVLAESVTSEAPLPSFDNSAMDGFAIKTQDVQGASFEHPVWLPLVGEAAAGRPWTRPLEQGEAVRIMTGAPVPSGAEAVIRVEDTLVHGDRVAFRVAARAGEHIRRAGEDVTAGQAVLLAGMPLTAGRIQMAAALGHGTLQAIRAPRVAILATGDELVEVFDPLAPGKIRNSNAYGLHAQILACGALPMPLGIAKDTREDTEAMIRRGLESADVVVSSGGVSMGDYDYVAEVAAKLGSVHITAIAQQPGKPLTYAILSGKPYFGLPGNPVSTSVCFEVYVRPALRKMMGHTAWFRPVVSARLQASVRSPKGKRSFLRVIVEATSEGYTARLTGPQGSGIIHSLVHANALAIVPEAVEHLDAGAPIDVMLIEQPEVTPCPI